MQREDENAIDVDAIDVASSSDRESGGVSESESGGVGGEKDGLGGFSGLFLCEPKELRAKDRELRKGENKDKRAGVNAVYPLASVMDKSVVKNCQKAAKAECFSTCDSKFLAQVNDELTLLVQECQGIEKERLFTEKEKKDAMQWWNAQKDKVLCRCCLKDTVDLYNENQKLPSSQLTWSTSSELDKAVVKIVLRLHQKQRPTDDPILKNLSKGVMGANQQNGNYKRHLKEQHSCTHQLWMKSYLSRKGEKTDPINQGESRERLDFVSTTLLNLKLTAFICHKDLSTDIGCDKVFRDLLAEATRGKQQKYVPAHKATVEMHRHDLFKAFQNQSRERFGAVKKALMANVVDPHEFSDLPLGFVSVQGDHWKSRSRKIPSWFGMICHIINPKTFEPTQIMLPLEQAAETHDGSNTAKWTINGMVNWLGDDAKLALCGYTSDGASAMIKAAKVTERLLREETNDRNISWTWCGAHRVSLAVKDALGFKMQNYVFVDGKFETTFNNTSTEPTATEPDQAAGTGGTQKQATEPAAEPDQPAGAEETQKQATEPDQPAFHDSADEIMEDEKDMYIGYALRTIFPSDEQQQEIGELRKKLKTPTCSKEKKIMTRVNDAMDEAAQRSAIFSRSEKLLTSLLKIQNDLEGYKSPLAPERNNETRWLGDLRVLRRDLHLKKAFKALVEKAHDKQRREKIYSDLKGSEGMKVLHRMFKLVLPEENENKLDLQIETCAVLEIVERFCLDLQYGFVGLADGFSRALTLMTDLHYIINKQQVLYGDPSKGCHIHSIKNSKLIQILMDQYKGKTTSYRLERKHGGGGDQVPFPH